MGSKYILIIEDDQMIVQLLRVLLAEEGYDIRSAVNADDALNILTTFRPALILVDIQLPGRSALELTRQLRENPEMNDASIIALTTYGTGDDEQNCLNAGCDGYILKPIDTSTFPDTVRSYMQKKARRTPRTQDDIANVLRNMRNTFITESLVELTELMSAPFPVDQNRLLRIVDRWAGVPCPLGREEVTDEAKKTEAFIEATIAVDIPVATATHPEVRRLITAETAAPAFEFNLPTEIIKTLSGKRIALTGFSAAEVGPFVRILEGAECFTRVVEAPAAGISAKMAERFDLIILNMGGPAEPTCRRNTPLRLNKPILLVGSHASISESVVSIETINGDFLATPWHSEELLVRCCKLLSSHWRNSTSLERPKQVVIADDDPVISTLLSATLGRMGVECRLAPTGTEALALVRTVRPEVLILDVNMPYMDGFDVLKILRNDELIKATPVVLLTARQEESDMLKGFLWGANDYIIKPFNLSEITTRIASYVLHNTY